MMTREEEALARVGLLAFYTDNNGWDLADYKFLLRGDPSIISCWRLEDDISNATTSSFNERVFVVRRQFNLHGPLLRESRTFGGNSDRVHVGRLQGFITERGMKAATIRLNPEFVEKYGSLNVRE